MSYTKGPWTAGNDNGFWGMDCCIEAATEIGAVVVCDFVHSSAIEEEANKALIAAAPDLLEALEALVADYEDYAYLPPSPNYDKAKKAIAKAKAKGEN